MTPSKDPKRLREEKIRTHPPSLKTGLQCKHCLRNDCQSSPKQSMSEEYALRSVGTALSKYWSSNAKEVLKYNTYSQPPEAETIVEMVTATAKSTGAAVHRRFRKK